MSKRRYMNHPVLVGKFNSFNKKNVGKNGLVEVNLNCNGNKIKVNVWEKEDRSTMTYLSGVEEGQVVDISFAKLKQREWDNNVYIEAQVNSPKLIKQTNDRENAVVVIEGDVYRFNVDNIKYDEQGKPYGEFKVLYFDTEVYNKDTGKNEYITPAEVLIGDIESRKKKLKDKFPDKSLEPYDELIESLKTDDTIDNVHSSFTQLVENDEYMNFYNTYLFNLKFEGKVGEKIVNLVNKKDNIKIGARIINRTIRDEFDQIEGHKTELKIEKFYGTNKKVEVEEVNTNAGEGW